MQTFVPYPSFTLTALVLDYRRLGKQRVEARQIIHALHNPRNAWRNHPAVRMWRGYEPALRAYGNTMIREWVRRGYRNAMPLLPVRRLRYPPWFGRADVHLSHQSMLLAKEPAWYARFDWDVEPGIGYVWPV